jgi:hypothetical protein
VDLTNKVAVVTGASSGIGASAVLALASHGATVVAVARRAERLVELSNQLADIVPYPCDLTHEPSCTQLIDAVVHDHGSIDILVNNAGVSRAKRAEFESPDEFRSVLELNLTVPYTLSRAAALHMFQQHEGGSIINVASILGLVGIGRIPQASYAASKGGLINLTRELAVQWARRKVRVNAIAPGWISTEMTSELFATDSGRDWLEQQTPMGRGGEAWEIDGAILYLASSASTFVTGTVVTVDGGWTAI